MSLLNSLFDVVRGWTPGGNAATIEESYEPHSSVPALDPLTEGDVVFLESDGTVARADGDDLAGAASVAALATLLAEQQQLWLVVSGNTEDEYDGLRPGGAGAANALGQVPFKVVAIKGCYMFETTKFVTRAYTPGMAVTVIGGEPDATDTGLGANVGYRQYGEVQAYDSATGLLTLTVEN